MEFTDEGILPMNSNERFTGHEFYTQHGLNWHDMGWRPYDGTTGITPTIERMAEDYYWISPYTYCGNNPVNRVDPDGQKWEISMTEDEDGNKNYDLKFTGVIYNNSSQNTNTKALVSEVEKQLNEIFNVSGDGYSVSFSSDLRIANSVDEIGETDHVLQVVDQNHFKKSNTAADADLGGMNVRIGTRVANQTILGMNTRTIAHEVGHTAGLGHPHDANQANNPLNAEDWDNNLMSIEI